ncbi:hypothetical protein NP493_582g03037 [Ridgeia piscesae]|uniref:Uncharacterized protein n=1 Tax=Ridgeia piscesae TaxID=27915 RepID=A0AAD9KU66_RIDPI|nr:hypothetical protein NP493_582g03037 [Ridgeia piscesae]
MTNPEDVKERCVDDLDKLVRFLTMKSWLLTRVLLLAVVACPVSGSIEKPRPPKWQLVFRSPFTNRNDVTSAEVKNIAKFMRQMMVCVSMNENCHLFGQRCCAGLRCSTRTLSPCDTNAEDMCRCQAEKVDANPRDSYILYRRRNTVDVTLHRFIFDNMPLGFGFVRRTRYVPNFWWWSAGALAFNQRRLLNIYEFIDIFDRAFSSSHAKDEEIVNDEHYVAMSMHCVVAL